MHRIKLSRIFWGILFFLSFFAGGKLKAEETEWIDLESLCANPIAQDLRKTFNDYLNPNQDVPRSMAVVRPQHFHLFKEKFVVVRIEPGDMGGVFVTVILNPKKMQKWGFWIYEIDKKIYEIRYIKNFPLTKKMLKEYKPLKEPDYQQFWL